MARREAAAASVARAAPTERELNPAPIVRERHTRPGETRPRASDKDLDRLVAKAWDAGWRVERGGSDHVKVYRPDGKIVSVPMTPSKQRTVPRVRASLRQGGLDL